MSRFSRALVFLAVPVLIVACSPGGTDTPLSPAGLRHDDTGTPVLGGNATPTDSSKTQTTSTTSTSSNGGLEDPDAATGTPVVGGN